MTLFYTYYTSITFFILLAFGGIFEGKVVGVKDGDTIEVLVNKEVRVVRLAHIDCPERRQPYSTKAKQYTSDLCYGKMVTVRHQKNLDRNKRYIGEVFIADTLNVNKKLVEAGYAWHYKQYSNDNSYHQLEHNARNNRRGLWKDAKPMAPWQWRKLSKIERDRFLGK